MQTVIVDPPAAVLAERKRLGLDVFDEVWDGEYHVVPSPSREHQRLNGRLLVALDPCVQAAGLEMLHEINLLESTAIGLGNFRIPDLAIHPPEIPGVVGIVGAASLVIEIRSPGDESFEKLPFYESLGVGEVLIIDRDTKAVRHWINGAGGLVESAGHDGRHQLRCIRAALHTVGETLVVTVGNVATRI